MKGHLKAIFLSIFAIIIFFLITYFVTNVFMKIFVGLRQTVITPDLVNSNLITAKKICKNNKLYLSEIAREFNDTIGEGKIMSQNPEKDMKTKKFRTIEVVVSKGAELVVVPNLVNKTLEIAKIELEKYFLTLGKIDYVYSEAYAKDKIISSSPIEDIFVRKNTKVNLVISLGKYNMNNSNNNDNYKELLKDL